MVTGWSLGRVQAVTPPPINVNVWDQGQLNNLKAMWYIVLHVREWFGVWGVPTRTE